ncbi:unnamed protein product [Gongylonema pulchrum]|uniref:Transmembrane protein n=1 Tax=Gongylonema pulchrum TaxID=637853 RepID=A0A183DUB2_9BILA|nr:unnamed protein product [Gongylonema pulchrum]
MLGVSLNDHVDDRIHRRLVFVSDMVAAMWKIKSFVAEDRGAFGEIDSTDEHEAHMPVTSILMFLTSFAML